MRASSKVPPHLDSPAAPTIPVGPKAMNGNIRTAIEQQQLMNFCMPEDQISSHGAHFGFNDRSCYGKR